MMTIDQEVIAMIGFNSILYFVCCIIPCLVDSSDADEVGCGPNFFLLLANFNFFTKKKFVFEQLAIKFHTVKHAN